MALTMEEQELLHQFGHEDRDFSQIEEAMQKTIYTRNGRRISQKRALEFLGQREYLSGISRSAFHFTALRTAQDGSEIYFDSRPLFR